MNKKLVGGVIAVIAIVALVITAIAAQRDDPKPSTDSSSTNSADSENIQGGQHANLPQDEGSDEGSTGDEGVIATDEVEIDNFSFTPASIKVKKGTTVTWTNKDSAPHTVTGVDSNKGPESGTLNGNDTYTFTFDEVGTFGYICDFHPSMKGEVTVTE
jgi:plastocyanin